MRVLNVSHLADTGGNGYRTVEAFRKHAPEHVYRFSCRTSNWLDYPRDLPWEGALAEWRRADVVHLRDGFQAESLLAAPARPTVIHHHGTQFRRHGRRLLAEQRKRRAVGLAATIDLLLMAPDDLTWMPALYDLDWLAAQRRKVDDGVLRISHAPTNRGIKGTEAFLVAARRLARELPVEVILLERTPWRECIRRRATADIHYDQVALGVGNSAIEAWGMGQPVVAGAAPATIERMRAEWGALPFYRADEGTIYQALRALAEPEVRAAWGIRGRLHAERFHSEIEGVRRLLAVYARACGVTV